MANTAGHSYVARRAIGGVIVVVVDRMEGEEQAEIVFASVDGAIDYLRSALVAGYSADPPPPPPEEDVDPGAARA